MRASLKRWKNMFSLEDTDCSHGCRPPSPPATRRIERPPYRAHRSLFRVVTEHTGGTIGAYFAHPFMQAGSYYLHI